MVHRIRAAHPVMNVWSVVLVVLISALLSACITTQVKGFTDPDYHAYQIRRVIVDSPHPLFDEAFANKSKQVAAVFESAREIFVPTRTYSAEDQVTIIRQRGYDTYLSIEITGDDQESRIVAFQSHSTASAYSNGYGSAYGQSSTTTVPVTAHNRQTTAKATLYEVKTGRVVCIGNIQTKAGGALYMSDSGTVYSMVDSLLKDLIKQGHLQRQDR